MPAPQRHLQATTLAALHRVAPSSQVPLSPPLPEAQQLAAGRSTVIHTSRQAATTTALVGYFVHLQCLLWLQAWHHMGLPWAQPSQQRQPQAPWQYGHV